MHAAAHRLHLEPVAADQSVAGDPSTGVAELGRFGGLDVGIWEMTPGVMRDVEAEEVFVVLSGRRRSSSPTAPRRSPWARATWYG